MLILASISIRPYSTTYEKSWAGDKHSQMQVCTAQQVQGLAYSEQDKHNYVLILLAISKERSLICII